VLVNELIKKYSISEDYNEYSKKPELWFSIRDCKEVSEMMKSKFTSSILSKYVVS
jgi:HEPN domain-containing protein